MIHASELRELVLERDQQKFDDFITSLSWIFEDIGFKALAAAKLGKTSIVAKYSNDLLKSRTDISSIRKYLTSYLHVHRGYEATYLDFDNVTTITLSWSLDD